MGASAELRSDYGLVAEILDYQYKTSQFSIDSWRVEAQLEAIDRALGSAGSAHGLQKRVGDRKFVAIGLAGTMALSIVGGLLVHPGAYLAPAWKLTRMLRWDRGWRPTVIRLYERLEGVEGDVFEAVHHLESAAVVTNFDALAARDFENAYGTVAPTARDVADLLPHVARDDVHDSLAALYARQVLRSDGKTFWIAF